MKPQLTMVLLFFGIIASCQETYNQHLINALETHNFIEEQILVPEDTITYYLKKYQKKPNKLVVFIQGSDANPLFSYKNNNGKYEYFRWFLDDYKNLSEDYGFIIIPKPGMEGICKDENINIPKKYYENNYREYRVNQISKAIEHFTENHLSNVNKVIVYGHSEGAAIGAALANENRQITHLGFWSGNVLNNFYEFSLFERIASLNGDQSDSLAHENIMGLLSWYKDIINNPSSTELDQFGYTNKRWATYEKPPIEDLLEVDIPIYTMFGTEDKSTPIETAYLLPVQFMEKRKDNLSFNICMDCDHGYVETIDNDEINHWDRIFEEFILWVENN